MNPRRSLSTLSVAAIAFDMLVVLAIPVYAQGVPDDSKQQAAPAVNQVLQHNIEEWIFQGRGIPEDWSHHHLVFSNPGTEEAAVANGTHDRWLSIVNDPRYIIQQLMRRAALGPAATDIAIIEETAQAEDAASAERIAAAQDPTPAAKSKKSKISKDWSTNLGSGTAATLTGVVGALNSSSISGSSTLAVDSVTFDASPPVPEVGTLTMGSSVPSNGTTLTVGSINYNFSSSTLGTPGANSCNVSTSSSSRTTTTTNLDDAITNGGGGGTSTWNCASGATPNSLVSATSSGHVVTLTAKTAGSTGFTESVGSTGFTSAVTTTGSDGTTSGTSSPPTFAYWSGATYVSSAQVATNIATAINANTTLQTVSTGVSATANTPSSGDLTVTARAAGTGGNSYAVTAAAFSAFTGGGDLSGGATATVQPNTFPAKFSFNTTSASCSNDFVVYPTGAQGATGAANIIGYNNLYTGGCSGTVPSVYWAYNTGTGEMVTTSPIISLDGTQVAFMESNGTTASLVLIKWAAETGESVTTPLTLTNSASGSAYRSCTPTASAPCMYTIAFTDGKNDTLSAPFCDYGDDLLYVGDDSGNLHQFAGVFNGSPAESVSPWPVHLGANKLSSPVYDTQGGFQGGYIFVGDMAGVFYAVGSGYGGTTAGQIHGNTGSLGDVIADAPLVDSSEGTEFVFVTTNGSYSATGDNAVWEFVSSFTTLGTPGVVSVGTGGTGYYLYAGDFDDVYYESGNPAYGHLYVVGNTGTVGGGTLYQVEIAYSSLTGTVKAVAGGLNSTEHPWPSPLIEFCNNGTSGCAITQQRNVTGKVSTTSPEITLSSGTFTSADVGAVVTGTDIPFGATISNVMSSTTANLSSAPTASVSSETVAIQGGQTTSGTDYVFFSVNRGTPSGCTNAAGDGCILSYNITNPTAVALSGSGLNVTTPGTNGCWATGGVIVDNSDTTLTGASQIYFVNLNGNAAGGPTGTTQTSSNCTAGTGNPINAVQAAQSSP